MKKMLLAICWIVLYLPVCAQTNLITFNDSIPGNWSTTGTTPLSLSSEHYKGGTRSLKWQPVGGDTLKANNLGILNRIPFRPTMPPVTWPSINRYSHLIPYWFV